MSKPKFLEVQSIDEIHQIIFALRGKSGTNDGDYRSKHLGATLEYLQSKQREQKSLTLAKLALMLGMSKRAIQENYFDGLLGFGIIKLNSNCDEWYWIGLSAITIKDGDVMHRDQTE